MDNVVVLGNGASRSAFVLNQLNQFGTVYGCNAIVRDWFPDYVACVDPLMVEEVKKSGFPEEKILTPQGEECFEPVEMYQMLFNQTPQATPKIGAGQFSLLHAIKNGAKYIRVIGFDFLCADDGKALSNMYEGTHGYGPETASNIQQTRYRFNYFIWLLKKYPEVKFDFMFPEGYNVYKFDIPNCIVTIGQNQA